MKRSVLLAAAFLLTCAASYLHAQLPNPALVGYWHNWSDANAPYRFIDSVDSRYNVITVAFAIPVSTTDMRMTFVPDRGSNQEFITRIQRVQATGKKVLLSVGGATASIDLTTTQNRDAFVTSMSNLLKTFGFDGVDIDIEHGASILVNGGTIANPQAAAQKNLIDAIKSIMTQYRADFGRKMLLTFAPETAYIQGGQSGYGSIWGGYLPIVDALRDSLDLIHVQLYNSGTMYGIDRNVYTQGTSDFIVAMTEAVIKGFTTQGGTFTGIPASKVAVGLPASANAAGGGYVDSTTISAAVKYLLGKGPKPGTYTLATAGGYADLRGMMTWSVNWDATTLNRGVYDYADVYGALFGPPTLPVPEKVVLQTPTSNEQLRINDATLRWFSSTPAVTAYHVELSVNGTIVYRDTSRLDTIVSVPNLPPASQPIWRVRAKNASGWGPWSDMRSFRTVPYPDRVALAAPSNSEKLRANAVTLRWRKSQPDIMHYRLTVMTESGTTLVDTVLLDTTYTRSLLPARTYSWRVVARNVSGWGEWSPSWTFATVPFPSAISLRSPLDQQLIADDSARLTWSISTPYVETYHLDVLKDGATILSDSLVRDTSHLLRSLRSGSTYRWRVRAKNISGWSPWTSYRQFRYLPVPGMVELTSPTDSARIANAEPLLMWKSATPEVSAYRYEVGRDSIIVMSDSMTTLLSVRVPQPDTGVWYRWRVQARNASGWGEWSRWRSFRVVDTTTTTTGIAGEDQLLHRLVIYPNPAADVLTVSSQDANNAEAIISTMSGEQVLRRTLQSAQSHMTIDVSTLPSGTYVLSVGRRSLRFVIER